VGAIAFGDKCIFCISGVNQNGINIASPAEFESLARSHHEKVHIKAEVFFDFRQQNV